MKGNLGKNRCRVMGRSQRRVCGLRNKQEAGEWNRVQVRYVRNSGICIERPRIVFQVDITDQNLDTAFMMKKKVGEAVFLVVPCFTTRWCSCLSHLIIVNRQVTRSLLCAPAEQLQQRDQQILLLLEEKEMIFRDMTECSTPLPEDGSPTRSSRILFRSNTEEALKGGPLMKSAINEGNLHSALPPSLSPPTVVHTLILSTSLYFFIVK